MRDLCLVSVGSVLYCVVMYGYTAVHSFSESAALQ